VLATILVGGTVGYLALQQPTGNEPVLQFGGVPSVEANPGLLSFNSKYVVASAIAVTTTLDTLVDDTELSNF